MRVEQIFSATSSDKNKLQSHLEGLLQSWRQLGIPPRWQLMNQLEDLIAWRGKNQITGLWKSPPLMLTATLDDGWGHGLEVIELSARVVGVRIQRIGLLQTPDQIVDCCHRLSPGLLGLTVLQFDSEDSLRLICENVHETTQVAAGGPPFQIDPEFAMRTKVDFAAKNVADFLGFLIESDFPHSHI